MGELTIDELVVLLHECAGEDDTVDLSGEILDTAFELLGYDSLAMFNTVSRIERDNGITLPDSVVVDAKTPRELLLEINTRLAKLA